MDVESSRFLELLGVSRWDTGEARGTLRSRGLVVLRLVTGARLRPVCASVKRLFLMHSESFSNDNLTLHNCCFSLWASAASMIDVHHTTDASLHTDDQPSASRSRRLGVNTGECGAAASCFPRRVPTGIGSAATLQQWSASSPSSS